MAGESQDGGMPSGLHILNGGNGPKIHDIDTLQSQWVFISEEKQQPGSVGRVFLEGFPFRWTN